MYWERNTRLSAAELSIANTVSQGSSEDDVSSGCRKLDSETWLSMHTGGPKNSFITTLNMRTLQSN